MSFWNNFYGLCSLPRLTDPADRKHSNRRPGPFSPVQRLSPQLLATQLHDQTDKELVDYKRAACVQWCWIHLLRSNTAQLYFIYCFKFFLKAEASMCKGLSYLPSSCLEKYVSSCVRSTMDFISEILNVCVFFVFQGEQDTCKVQPFGWSTPEV